MKTTVDLSTALLREARRRAAREGVTLETLIERGLRRVVSEAQPAAPFKLRRGSVKGEGLRPELRNASWDQLLELIYEGRG